METIRIAGVECRVDKLSTLTYEAIYNSAIGIKGNRASLIDKELRDNGFKPVKADRSQTQADQPSNGGKTSKRGSSKKQRGNSKSRKK